MEASGNCLVGVVKGRRKEKLVFRGAIPFFVDDFGVFVTVDHAIVGERLDDPEPCGYHIGGNQMLVIGRPCCAM